MIVWDHDEVRTCAPCRGRAARSNAPCLCGRRAAFHALMTDLFHNRLAGGAGMSCLELAAYYRAALDRHAGRSAAL
jgi:hypothetical protein